MITDKGNKYIILLSALITFSANMPILKVGPLSLSFFFGICLIITVLLIKPRYSKINKDSNELLILIILSVFALIFSPVEFNGSTLFSVLQIFYWFILSIIFSNIYKIAETRLYLLANMVVLIIIFIIFILYPGEHGPLSQNESSFIAVSLWPFGLKLYTRWKKSAYILFSLILIYLIGSRTGLIICLIQLLSIYALTKFSSKTFLRFLSSIVVGIILISSMNVRRNIAEVLFPDATDMQLLIENPNIAFQMDKSWVQRRIQQEKCKQVFKNYPLLGIGPLNVQKYRIFINPSNMHDVDDSILALEYQNSTNRSAHNSYFQFLAENGLIGIILGIIILYRILKGLYKNKNISYMNIIVLVSAIGLFINLYMVSALWGTNTWILIGLYLGYSRRHYLSITSTSP